MKTLLFFLIQALLLLTFNLKAQDNTIICKGDKYFDQNQFEAAKKAYMKDLDSKSKRISQHAWMRLADCYRISGEFEKAEATYKKILKKRKSHPESYLNYGLSLKSSAKFEEAKLQFEEYIKLKPTDPMGKIYLRSCDSAQKWLDLTIGKEVKNLEKINTEFSEFSPVILNNKLYFCSSRDGSKSALISFDGGNDVNRMDLYSVDIDKLESVAGNKNEINNIKELNTVLHEGSASFSPNGEEVFFTRTVKGKRVEDSNEIKDLLQIFYSKKDSSGKWSKPTNQLAFNSHIYSTCQPALSPNGKTLFFMADRPGGYGKTDIYFSKKQEDGTWGKITNAGNGINTFGYELFPYVVNDTTLYFSSNAHPGMGQLDIFRSTLVDGKWSNVQNLQPPINSIGNDFGITFDNKSNRGFFSSDRFNGKGIEDIYAFSEDIPLELNLINDTLIFADKKVFDGIKYKLVNEMDSSETELNSVNDIYAIKLENKISYSLIAKKNGFPYNKIQIMVSKDTLTQDLNIKLASETYSIKLNSSFSGTFLKKILENENRLFHSTTSETEGMPAYFKMDTLGCFKYPGVIGSNTRVLFSTKPIPTQF